MKREETKLRLINILHMHAFLKDKHVDAIS